MIIFSLVRARVSLAVLMNLHVRLETCFLEQNPRCGLADEGQFGVTTADTSVFTTNHSVARTYFLYIHYRMEVTES